MRRSSWCGRRWRGGVWCILCVLCLTCLILKDTLYYFLSDQHAVRRRRCPPDVLDVDGCTSWRPLHLHHPTCNCTRRVLVLHDTCTGITGSEVERHLTFIQERFGESTCSDQATLRGPRQLVISVSSDEMTQKDLDALSYTITQVNQLYKGWVLRLYTVVKLHTLPGLCPLVCSNDNLDICDVGDLSQPVNKWNESGRVGWRWAVLGDPLVWVWAVRSLDLALLPREAHAVTQFLNSDKCWHLMRDHLSHTDSPLGAGLVGGKISWDAVKLREMQQRLLREVSSTRNEKLILKELLPVLDDDTMTHDSVACHKTPRAIPFPSRRQPGHWVGMPSPQQLRHTSSPNIIYKTKQQLHERSVQGHTFQKDYSRQLNESGIKSGNEFAPRQDGAEQISTATDTKVQPLHDSQKVNKSISETDKYYQRRHDQRTNSAKEVEINLESGIPVCPSSCRPPLHPDWNYC